MKIIKNIKAKKITSKSAVAVGVFDGVHRGHQVILNKVVKEAKKRKLKSVVITFSLHPAKMLYGKNAPLMLSSLEHRLNLISQAGVDACILINFDKNFARTKAESFIKNILVNKTGIKVLVIGKGFKFGAGTTGDMRLLEFLGKKYRFKIFAINNLKYKNNVISSTLIRKLIAMGKLKDASLLLGRRVSVLGKVVKGFRIGRTIGIPTANIDPHNEAIPPDGIYAVKVIYGKKLYKGVVNIGRNPTIAVLKNRVIEVHIFNFSRNIYGKDIEILFYKKIRNEKKFSNIAKLKTAIFKDIDTAKRMLK